MARGVWRTTVHGSLRVGHNWATELNWCFIMAESEEELKSLLVKVKEESEKLGLKLKIQKTKIVASGPITSWQIDVEKMETVTDFIFLGSKITADCDWSHKIRSCLLLERKVMTNLVQFSSVTQSNPLWPHGLQHTRPGSPSPTPGVYPNSCPLSQWCHPTISSSVFSPSPPVFNHSKQWQI